MIKFILNNEIVHTAVNAGITLLDFIREHKQLKGTKIGCREGDCGACTVLVGELVEDKVSYKSITSCISPLGNVNGKHVVTVEGVNIPSQLNAVQQAMADQYATQCGFCTPGFVVSMTGFALERKNPSNQTCNDAISGNICRCTGYKSIEKAGLEIEQKLLHKDANDSINWLIKEGFIPDYFTTIPVQLQSINPADLNNEGRIVANGTDLYVRSADELAEKQVRLVADIPRLKGIKLDGNVCDIGASTTVAEMFESEVIHSQFPQLAKFFKLVSSEQIRNMGTISGNFVNASPIGDMTIFFLALDATLTIESETHDDRIVPLREFYHAYKKYDLQEGELVKSISFEKVQSTDYFNFEKVSKRTHLDIASVNSAAKFKVENNVIQAAHVSIGGSAPIPKYLDKTSKFLKDKVITPANIIEAASILDEEIAPISDVRGSADYKRLLARQLFFAHFMELFPEQIQLKQLIL